MNPQAKPGKAAKGVSVPLSSPPLPVREPLMTFAPSPEMGELFQRLRTVQAEIDRRKADELARLREIQDRD